ncbi:MAG TPA: preprotein translocase subunit SecE [Steroidobacteraceae bacterium]|nr:preprotein translocase subunit SecE [Steroidobacteraceae bacterium]
MTEQAQQGSSALDTLKLVAAIAIVVGGIASFYSLPWPIWARWLVVLASLSVGILVALQSAQGRMFWDFVQGSRIELRKVVWRDRDAPPTWQVAMLVFVVITVLTLFFWGLDWGLASLTRWLSGQGA